MKQNKNNFNCLHNLWACFLILNVNVAGTRTICTIAMDKLLTDWRLTHSESEILFSEQTTATGVMILAKFCWFFCAFKENMVFGFFRSLPPNNAFSPQANRAFSKILSNTWGEISWNVKLQGYDFDCQSNHGIFMLSACRLVYRETQMTQK